ncbi:TPA: CDP-glycerol glycerophosphotransferase family protein [Escherichia coli]|nr:CDP-glycerol glycerophosphotransferase family protein [Escherichia coli]
MLLTKLAKKICQSKEYINVISLYKKKEWEKALLFFEKSIIKKTKHAESYFKAGICNLKLHRYEEAFKYISKALELEPSNIQWKEQLEQCARHLDKLNNHMVSKSSTEEDLLREKLNTDFNNPKLHDRLAEVLHKKGRWWQEVDTLKNAIKLDPSIPERYFKLGTALEKMGRFNEASIYYKKGLEFNKKHDAIWYYALGYSLESDETNNVENVRSSKIAYATAISLDKKLNSNKFGIGAFHQYKGRWAKAIDAYEKHTSINPLCAELYYRLGLSYDRCYQWDKAAENYRKALSLDENHPYWHYRLGFVLERSQKYLDAAVAYQFAAQSNIKHISIWYYRSGYAYAKANKYRQSCEMYIKAYDSSQEIYASQIKVIDNNDTHLNSYRKKLKYESRINTLESAISNSCINYGLWYELGKTYESSCNWNDAVIAYHEGIMRNNTYTKDYYYRIGYSLFRDGNYQQACNFFRKIEIFGTPYGAPDDILTKNLTFRRNATYTEFYETLSIEKNTILYESFHGASISCNPYALFLDIIDDQRFDNFRHIWVINNEKKIPEQLKNKKNVYFVSRQSDLYMQCLASCEFLINNVSFPEYFIRKKGQRYLNTWHGTPIKFLGKDIKDEFLAHKNVARNFLHTTHLLSPNTHTTNILLDRYDISNIFSGEIKELGYPRIDRTINLSSERKEYIRRKINANVYDKVVLYAPTWRGIHGKATLDIEKLKNDLEKLADQDCHIVFRGHHMIEKLVSEQNISGITIVPSEIDTNELLGAIDILITDYSSIAFDFFVMNRPVIYYAYDIEQYNNERGLYFPLNELPGTVCFNDVELLNTLSGYLRNEIYFDASKGIDKFCKNDDGSVCGKVIEWFFFEEKSILLNKNKNKNILFYIGPFIPNGILSSWLNLISVIDRDKYNISLVVDPKSIHGFQERFEQFKRVSPDIQVIGTCGNMLYNIEEKWLNDKLNNQFTLASKEMYDILDHAYQREFLRLFGYSHIDHLIHFEGYNQSWVIRFANAPKDTVRNKIIFQHNDKLSEWRERFPYLRVVFDFYKSYNKIVSVSEKTMELNRDNLSEFFNIEHDKFIYCDNVQNPDEVIKKSDDIDTSGFIFENDKIYFITLGRLSVEKDQQKLINAFCRLQKLYPNIELLILGDGPLKIDLQRQIITLGLEKSVHLLGRISNPFPLLKRADCFVLSSNHEGQPMVLFEAMILDKPIISTDITGSRSALEGRSGVLVENSVDGLFNGMRDFILGRLEFKHFDIESYQKNALSMFYEKCLH